MNGQLVPILCYRLMVQPLSPQQLQALKHQLWTALAQQGGVSTKVSLKDRHQPKLRLGQNIRDLTIAIPKFKVASGIQFLNREGRTSLVGSCNKLSSPLTRIGFLTLSSDSCSALGLEYNGLPWNPTPHDPLIPRDHL